MTSSLLQSAKLTWLFVRNPPRAIECCTPPGGTVTVAGERVDTLSETGMARFRRRRIGMIFQFFNLLDDLTVADNVLLPAQLAGTPRATAAARAGGRTAAAAGRRSARAGGRTGLSYSAWAPALPTSVVCASAPTQTALMLQNSLMP